MKPDRCYVYIMTNGGKTVLYTGMTNDLKRRVFEHRTMQVKGFAGRYRFGQAPLLLGVRFP